MSDISVIRHESVFKPSDYNYMPISIVGAGATGSRVFMALVELGLTNIQVFDFDIVEAHNLANQIYLNGDIGIPKVNACQNAYLQKTGYGAPDDMDFINTVVPDPAFPLKGVVFLLTDTMSSREEIMRTAIRNNPDVHLVIETRMASTHGEIYTFDPHIDSKHDAWVNSLISDDDGEVSPCGGSISVGTTASVIANLAVWDMVKYHVDPLALAEHTSIMLKPLIVTTKAKIDE